MKYVFYHNLVIVACCGILAIAGCRSARNVTTDIDSGRTVEKVESIRDSTRRVEIVEQKTDGARFDDEQIFTRTIDYDTTGTVRRVQETWRDRQRRDLVAEERNVRTVSMTLRDSIATVKDSTKTTTVTKENYKTDSRPVQGAEWMWVILGAGLLLVIIGVILKRR